MAIFLTGSTGYIGAHIAANLLHDHGASLNLLVRARDPHEAEDRLWHALQLHLDFQALLRILADPDAGVSRRPDRRAIWTVAR